MKDTPIKVYVLYKKLGTSKWFVKVFFEDATAEGFVSIPIIQVI